MKTWFDNVPLVGCILRRRRYATLKAQRYRSQHVAELRAFLGAKRSAIAAEKQIQDNAAKRRSETARSIWHPEGYGGFLRPRMNLFIHRKRRR